MIKRKNTYKIGMIGVGNIGHKHITPAKETGRWEIAYVCDLNDMHLARAGELAPEAKQVKDYRQIIDDPEITAVSINTLSNIRPEIIRAAAAAGKHILCEKPIAANPVEARKLFNDVSGSGVMMTVNMPNRNHEWLRRAKKLIDEGEIGELAVIRINNCDGGKKVPEHLKPHPHFHVEGHVLHDCGMHYVDIINWFAESEIKNYDARAVRFWNKIDEMYFMVYGSYQNNIQFDLTSSHSYTSLSKKRQCSGTWEFIGSYGAILATNLYVDQTVNLRVNGRTQAYSENLPHGSKEFFTYYLEFADAVDTGDIGLLPTFENAVKSSELSQAMVDMALAKHVPNFGTMKDIEEAVANYTPVTV